MLFTAANTYNDIENCSVGDFGCGPGILSIASNVLGSSFTVGFDVDTEALDNAWVNCRKLNIFDIDLVQTDILSLNINYS
jgi:predicted RNA methylase